MTTAAACVFVFFALVTGSAALFASGRRGRGAPDERVRRLRQGADGQRSHAVAPTLKRGYSSIPSLSRFLSSSPWADAAALQLQQANVRLRVGEYLLCRLLLAGLLFVSIVLIAQFHPLGLVIAVVLGGVGYLLPALVLSFLRRRRIALIEKQLVEFLPMLASSLRSGFAFLQSVELAARQLGPPLADELALLINDVNLGATMEAALLDLGRRAGSVDVDMMITAVMVQRTTGGNLSEVLDQAAETLRDRERIRGDVQTLTAQQRLTGLILSIYPAAIGLLLLVMMPSVWSVLFTDTLGRIFFSFAVGLQFIGFVVMQRVMKIEI